jgi:hypothetical protein
MHSNQRKIINFKLNIIKIKTFCALKDRPQKWRKYLQINTSDKDFVSRIHKELLHLNNKMNNPILKRGKGSDWTLIQKT